jgi:hypothetical protein
MDYWRANPKSAPAAVQRQLGYLPDYQMVENQTSYSNKGDYTIIRQGDTLMRYKNNPLTGKPDGKEPGEAVLQYGKPSFSANNSSPMPTGPASGFTPGSNIFQGGANNRVEVLPAGGPIKPGGRPPINGDRNDPYMEQQRKKPADNFTGKSPYARTTPEEAWALEKAAASGDKKAKAEISIRLQTKDETGNHTLSMSRPALDRLHGKTDSPGIREAAELAKASGVSQGGAGIFQGGANNNVEQRPSGAAGKAGYSPEDAKRYAQREADIRKIQNSKSYTNEQPNNLTFQSSPKQINDLAADAMKKGAAGEKARAALTQRAAAGDPQAANTLQTLNSRPDAQPTQSNAGDLYTRALQAPTLAERNDATKQLADIAMSGNPEARAMVDKIRSAGTKQASSRPSSGANTPSSDASQPRQPSRIIQPTSSQNQNISASGSGPRKEPTAGEMAAEIDKQNRAKEMAAAAAKARSPEAIRERQNQHAQNQIKLAQDALRANPNNPKTQADAQKQISAAMQTLQNNQQAGGKKGGGGGGGGGRRGGGSKQPPLTAKQRNQMADDLASKRAEQADRRAEMEQKMKEGRGLETENSKKFWEDYNKKKAEREKEKENTPTPKPDLGPDIGMPDTSVPGTSWGPTSSSASQGGSGGEKSGALLGYLRRKKLGLA